MSQVLRMHSQSKVNVFSFNVISVLFAFDPLIHFFPIAHTHAQPFPSEYCQVSVPLQCLIAN